MIRKQRDDLENYISKNTFFLNDDNKRREEYRLKTAYEAGGFSLSENQRLAKLYEQAKYIPLKRAPTLSQQLSKLTGPQLSALQQFAKDSQDSNGPYIFIADQNGKIFSSINYEDDYDKSRLNMLVQNYMGNLVVFRYFENDPKYVQLTELIITSYTHSSELGTNLRDFLNGSNLDLANLKSDKQADIDNEAKQSQQQLIVSNADHLSELIEQNKKLHELLLRPPKAIKDKDDTDPEDKPKEEEIDLGDKTEEEKLKEIKDEIDKLGSTDMDKTFELINQAKALQKKIDDKGKVESIKFEDQGLQEDLKKEIEDLRSEISKAKTEDEKKELEDDKVHKMAAIDLAKKVLDAAKNSKHLYKNNKIRDENFTGSDLFNVLYKPADDYFRGKFGNKATEYMTDLFRDVTLLYKAPKGLRDLTALSERLKDFKKINKDFVISDFINKIGFKQKK